MRDETYIIPEEIQHLRGNIQIGQNVKAFYTGLWEGERKKHRVTVVEKYRHHFVCEFRSGVKECFTYVQILLGDGVWLV